MESCGSEEFSALDRDRIGCALAMDVLRMGWLRAIGIDPVERRPAARAASTLQDQPSSSLLLGVRTREVTAAQRLVGRASWSWLPRNRAIRAANQSSPPTLVAPEGFAMRFCLPSAPAPLE